MKFRATIQLYSKTGTGIVVPEEMAEGLGTGKRPPVRVTINNYTYRSTVAPMRGEFKIPVSAEVRESAGVAAGDEVDVDIELDTEPCEIEVPPDFQEALDHDADAKRSLEELSYSKKQRYVLPIGQAKTAETR